MPVLASEPYPRILYPFLYCSERAILTSSYSVLSNLYFLELAASILPRLEISIILKTALGLLSFKRDEIGVLRTEATVSNMIECSFFVMTEYPVTVTFASKLLSLFEFIILNLS